MISIVFVLLAVSTISWLEIRTLKGKGKGKGREIFIFLLLMSAGSVLFTLELMQVSLPNPLKISMSIFDPVSKAIFAALS